MNETANKHTTQPSVLVILRKNIEKSILIMKKENIISDAAGTKI